MHPRLDPAEIPPLPDLSFETALWQKGILQVAGIDEAGRGCWAGPVSASAVILPPNPEIFTTLQGVNDSKKLRPDQRATWSSTIKKKALAWGVGFASVEEIDQYGIVPATRLAVKRALSELQILPAHLLLDYLTLPDLCIGQTSLIKGDARSLSIASASILAKTSRDTFMTELAREYPQYGFDAHKGYGTAAHRTALSKFGRTPLHRCSFKPVKSMIS